jgi:Shikimate kinase
MVCVHASKVKSPFLSSWSPLTISGQNVTTCVILNVAGATVTLMKTQAGPDKASAALPCPRSAMIVVVMGCSGCGKSTVGSQLADCLEWRFLDADDYHPQGNIVKMSHGEPLIPCIAQGCTSILQPGATHRALLSRRCDVSSPAQIRTWLKADQGCQAT